MLGLPFAEAVGLVDGVRRLGLEDRRGRDGRQHGPAEPLQRWPMTVVSDDVAVAHDISASGIAWYLCAMGDVYARSVARQGYPTAVQAILDANPRPRPDAGVVPAEAQVVLDQLTAYGTAAQVRDRLAEWEDTVDLTMIGLPPGLPWPAIEATLRAAAPTG